MPLPPLSPTAQPTANRNSRLASFIGLSTSGTASPPPLIAPPNSQSRRGSGAYDDYADSEISSNNGGGYDNRGVKEKTMPAKRQVFIKSPRPDLPLVLTETEKARRWATKVKKRQQAVIERAKSVPPLDPVKAFLGTSARRRATDRTAPGSIIPTMGGGESQDRQTYLREIEASIMKPSPLQMQRRQKLEYIYRELQKYNTVKHELSNGKKGVGSTFSDIKSEISTRYGEQSFGGSTTLQRENSYFARKPSQVSFATRPAAGGGASIGSSALLMEGGLGGSMRRAITPPGSPSGFFSAATVQRQGCPLKRSSIVDTMLTRTEQEDIRAAYEAYTTVITTFSALHEFVGKLGEHVPEAEFSEIVDECHWSAIGTGVIPMHSLLYVMAKVKEIHIASVVDDLTAAFRALSTDGEAIEADKFREAVLNFQLTVDVEKMLLEADEDGSGLIELDEFQSMIDGIIDTTGKNDMEEELYGAFGESTTRRSSHSMTTGDADLQRLRRGGSSGGTEKYETAEEETKRKLKLMEQDLEGIGGTRQKKKKKRKKLSSSPTAADGRGVKKGSAGLVDLLGTPVMTEASSGVQGTPSSSTATELNFLRTSQDQDQHVEGGEGGTSTYIHPGGTSNAGSPAPARGRSQSVGEALLGIEPVTAAKPPLARKQMMALGVARKLQDLRRVKKKKYITITDPKTGQEKHLKLPSIKGSVDQLNPFQRAEPTWKVSFQSYMYK